MPLSKHGACRITISGQVQGVGFRLFVYRLAHQHHIKGWVRNVDGAVEIHAEGELPQLQRFGEALLSEAPPLSTPGPLSVTACAPQHAGVFSILESQSLTSADVHLPADGFVCADCLAELHNPANRRHRYPFINCTQCGPRYTLITALPYDRPNTAMRDFALCPDCRQEYGNPLDRRFHAEPIACPVCESHLQFVSGDETHQGDEAALAADAVALSHVDGDIMVTTDGFTVEPLEFPGGDIGSLAVHGVVNDLAVAGADPLYFTVSALIEEGLEIATLDRLIASFVQAARQNHVAVVAGDTKVVRRGEGSGLYLSVTGIGVRRAGAQLAMNRIVPGDVVLVSGPVGDHGIAVMLAREQFGLSGELRSDSASVLPLMRAVRDFPDLKFMRDPTRGELATVAHEIARASGHSVALEQNAVPLRPEVVSVCEMLGYDPYFLACEGRVVAVADPYAANELLARWHALPEGRGACIIGRIETGGSRVILETSLGGRRVLDELEDDPLPRIC